MFEKFPSLTRFSHGWSISEKIDGSNSQIIIFNREAEEEGYEKADRAIAADGGDIFVMAGSRNGLITPQNDNHGFAKWVVANSGMLIETLGEGRHFGEWWGQGIQRKYGLSEKRFSLFNTFRWKQNELPKGLHVVPSFCINEYLDNPGAKALEALEDLRVNGSRAAPGFMKPEGVVMFHGPSGTAFKKTFDYDEQGKWAENQVARNG